MSKKRSIVLIDYENIHNIDMSLFQGKDTIIKIFVGHKQDKIPFELVRSTHKMGRYVEWIKVDRNGNNSLDFYIAFYLGKVNTITKNISCFILSKDKGFDSLIAHLNKKNISCQRIENLDKLLPNKKVPTISKVEPTMVATFNERLAKVIEKLTKIKQNARPQKRITLHNFTKSIFHPQKLDDREVEIILEKLIDDEKIAEVNNKIAYKF